MGYKTVKYCRLCKKRYTVPQGQLVRHYCEDCQKKFREEKEEEEDGRNS